MLRLDTQAACAFFVLKLGTLECIEGVALGLLAGPFGSGGCFGVAAFALAAGDFGELEFEACVEEDGRQSVKGLDSGATVLTLLQSPRHLDLLQGSLLRSQSSPPRLIRQLPMRQKLTRRSRQ